MFWKVTGCRHKRQRLRNGSREQKARETRHPTAERGAGCDSTLESGECSEALLGQSANLENGEEKRRYYGNGIELFELDNGTVAL